MKLENKRQFYIVILVALLAGAIGSIFFDRLILPKLSEVKGFGWLIKYASNAPIVINRKQEIYLNEGANFIELAKQANNATVSFYSKNDLTYLGNGIILSSDGLIFTSKAVIGNANEFTVVSNSGQKFAGVLSALDPKTDTAIVRITADDLAVLPFAEAAKMQAGQKILTVGQMNKELTRDFASGVITRSVANNKGLYQVFYSENLSESFETDAKLNRGFAGSPILNLEGRLVAMNTDGSGKLVTAENMQTALSSYLTTGKIIRPRLGLKFIELSQVATTLRGLNRVGVLAVSVDADSPAAKSGILPQDLIFEIDGQKLDNKSFEQTLNSHSIGQMKAKLLRGGKDVEVTISLEPTR